MSVHSLLDKRNYQCSSLLQLGFRDVSNHRLHPNNLHQREQHPKTTPLSTSNERYVVKRSPNQGTVKILSQIDRGGLGPALL